MSAPGQDAAQPGTAPDGQGQSQDRTAYQSILGEDTFQDVPEELRPHLTEYVRTRVDPHIQERFTEAAQFKQQMEPYSQIEGLTDLDPQDVDGLVEFGYTMQAALDEQHPQRQQAIESLQQTWEQLGEQFGFFDGDDDSGDGDDGDGEGTDEPQYMTRDEFEAELERRMGERDQQSEMEKLTDQNLSELQEGVQGLDLPGEPGSEERKQAEDDIWTFMQRFSDDDSLDNASLVQKAHEEYLRLTGGAQRRLLEDDGQQGETLRGGGADTAPEEIHGWREADQAAKARLTGAR